MTDVVDKERDQFLRELVRSVIIGAVGNHHREAVGVVEGADEMVRAGLGGAIRAVRLIPGRLDEQGSVHLQGAIDLVGRDMVEALSFKMAFPGNFRRLQQAECTQNIGLGKGEGILDGAVNMALGSEVDHAVDRIVLEDLADCVKVADVGLDEDIVGGYFDVLQVGQVAGIGQFVEIDDAVIRVFLDEETDNMAADKASAAGNKDVSLEFHGYRLVESDATNCLKLGWLRSFSERISRPAGICQSMPRSGSSQAMAPSACGQ